MALLLLCWTIDAAQAWAYLGSEEGRLFFLTDDDRLISFPAVLVWALALIVVLAIAMSIVGPQGATHSVIQTGFPQSVAHFEDQAAQAHALRRKLDADTELAESILRNARTHGEVGELGEILDHEQVKRLLRNGG